MTFNNILKNLPSGQTAALERPQIAAAAWSNTATVRFLESMYPFNG